MCLHIVQQLVGLCCLPRVACRRSLSQKGVRFIDQKDRPLVISLRKCVAKVFLRLANIAAQNAGCLLVENINPNAGCEVTCERSLARPRWSPKQNVDADGSIVFSPEWAASTAVIIARSTSVFRASVVYCSSLVGRGRNAVLNKRDCPVRRISSRVLVKVSGGRALFFLRCSKVERALHIEAGVSGYLVAKDWMRA